jgi:hypothetical protein
VHLPRTVNHLNANTTAVFYKKVKGKGVLMKHCCSSANCSHKRSLNLCACCSPAGVYHSGNRVATLTGKFQVSALITVKLCPEGNEFFYSPRSLIN